MNKNINSEQAQKNLFTEESNTKKEMPKLKERMVLSGFNETK
jgi:hypothetical protein